MESWSRAILEWVNCLDILEVHINDLKDLRDGKFYAKLIKILSNKALDDDQEDRDLVSRFIKETYPEFFGKVQESKVNCKEIHIASLLLLHSSHEPKLHRPMCMKLSNETQIKIKSFLEKVLDYGSCLTRENLNTAIMETVDNLVKTPPVTPKMRPLKDFFNSPATTVRKNYNRIMDERTREVRSLKAELETERFEKADLQEDLEIQKEKNLSLQQKLQEKIAEIKKMREESTRFETPQSSKKKRDVKTPMNRNSVKVQEQLEEEITLLKSEIINLQDENKSLIRKLTSVERSCITFKERSKMNERNLETLLIQADLKDQEIEELKNHNEELRSHIQEMRRQTIGEQSFEMEMTAMSPSNCSLNGSEFLSSVIDIQLQEAKEESKIFKSQVADLNQRLESIQRDYQTLQESNKTLETELILFHNTKEELSGVRNELKKYIETSETLEKEKIHFRKETAKFEELFLSEAKLLRQSEQRNEVLKTNFHDLENLLSQENNRVRNLEDLLSQKSEILQTEALRYDDLAQKHHRLKQENSESLEDVKKLRNLVFMKENSFSQAQQEIKELELDLRNVKNELQNVQELLNTEKIRAEDLESVITKMKFEYKETLEGELSRYQILEEKYVILEWEKVNLLQETKDLNLRIESKEKLLKEFSEKSENLLSDLRDLDMKLQCTKQEVAEERQRVGDLEATINRMESDKKELIENQFSKYQDLEEKYVNLGREKLNLVKDVEDLNKAVSAKDKLFEQCLKEKENLESTLQDLKERFIRIEDSLGQERTRVTDLESEITLVKEEREEALQIQITSYQNLERIHTNVEKEKTNLETEINRLNSLILSKDQLLGQSQEKNGKFETDLRDLNNNLEIVKNLLSDEKTRVHDLESTLSQMRLEHEKTVEEGTLKYKDLEEKYSHLEQEKVKLLQETENLSLEIVGNKNLLTQYQKEKEKLITQLEDLNNKLRCREESLTEEKSKVENLESTISLIEREREETLQCQLKNYQVLEKKHMDLEKEKLELLKDTENLSNLLSSKGEQLQKSQQHSAKLASDLCDSKEELKAVRNELDMAIANIKSLNSTLAEMKLETCKIIQTNENLQTEISSLKSSKGDLYEAKEQLHKQSEELEQEKLRLLEEIEELKTHVSSKEQLLTQTQQRNEDLNSKLKDLDKEMKSMQNLLSKKITVVEELEFTIAHVKREKEESLQSQLISYQALEKKHMDLEKAKLELLKDTENLENLLSSKEEQLQQSQHHSAKLDSDLCDAKEELKSVRNELETAIANIKSLESTLAEMKLETCKIIQANENLQTEISSLKSSKDDLYEAKEQLHKQSEELEQEKLRLLEEIKELKTRVSMEEVLSTQTQQQNEYLNSKLKDLDEEMKSKQNLLITKSTRIEDLESIVSETEKERKESLAIIEELKSENVEHKKLIQSCTSILTELVKQSSRLTSNEIIETDDLTILDLSKKLKTLINSLEVIYNAKDSDLKHFEADVSTLNITLSKLKTDLINFEEMKTRDDKVISDYLKEITDLRIMAKEKDTLLEDMDKLEKQLSEERSKTNLLNEEKKLFGHNLSDVKNSLILLKNEKLILVENIRNQNEDLLNKISEISEIIVKMEDQIERDNKTILHLREEKTFTDKKYEAENKMRKELETKYESLENENKIQMKEKKELKDKLNIIRVRNAKLEKNLDELRKENKKLENEKLSAAGEQSKLEELSNSISKLELQIQELEAEKIQLSKRPTEQDFDSRLKEVHLEYDQKLEKIKQKMKTAYNEQIAKVNRDQEKLMQEKLNSQRIKMEEQCRKHAEDITKYKEHVTKLSSDYWDVGEKLLVEKQQKEQLAQQLQDLRSRYQYHESRTSSANSALSQSISNARSKTASLDRREFSAPTTNREEALAALRNVQTIKEEVITCSRRESIQSVQTLQGMGNAFRAEDEEGEVFNTNYLADMKAGRCSLAPDLERLSVLQMRNAQCKPHLKSSYPAETQFQPTTFTEEDIKSGNAIEDVFNDSLSQSLLPGEKSKKRDRTQTMYKRPGPPTPSKNGGRLSLQGNELKSPTSRVLRERNVERRSTATPRRLKDLFGGSSRRQDENVSGTPKGRRLSSIFRKPK